MTCQIDQSGKIEQTERHSIVSCTNSRLLTIFLNRKEKRIVQKIFRQVKLDQYFPYLTFSAMISLLIFKSKITNKITIDKEYLGHEEFIKNHIIQNLQLLGVKQLPTLTFGHVGKLSEAHQEAYRVAMKKKKPTYITNAKEILRIVLGIKKTG